MIDIVIELQEKFKLPENDYNDKLEDNSTNTNVKTN